MKKLAIIIDSFCSKELKDIKSSYEDHYFLSLQVILDGVTFRDDQGLSKLEILKKMNNSKDIKTSLPSPAETESLFKKLSKEYKNIIYLSVGSALSGTYNTAVNISKEFKNIHVVNNNLVGEAFFELSKWLKNNENKSIKFLLEECKRVSFQSPTYIIPKNNEAFIKGGRLGKAAGFLLEKTKTVPIISYESKEKLHKKMIKRSGKKAIIFAVEKTEKFIKENPGKKWVWNIEHGIDEELSLMAKDILIKKGFSPTYNVTNAVVIAHTGDGAFSVGVYEKLV